MRIYSSILRFKANRPPSLVSECREGVSALPLRGEPAAQEVRPRGEVLRPSPELPRKHFELPLFFSHAEHKLPLSEPERLGLRLRCHGRRPWGEVALGNQVPIVREDFVRDPRNRAIPQLNTARELANRHLLIDPG